MKERGLILAFLTITATSFGQHVDTLSLWNYRLDSPYVTRFQDSVKPIAYISFWRTKPISNDPKLSDQAHVPSIDFEIFDIGDSSFCYQTSLHTRIYSSCLPPNVGGDIFVVGKFIFLNRRVCVGCGSSTTPNIDYCRPIIKFILSRLTENDISTLANIVRQLHIKSGRR
jgi:hypothetical protein